MKFECVKQKLEEVVVKADRVTTKNSTLPVLSCVLLIVKDSILTVRATNLDLGIEITLPVKSSEDGVTAVPSGTLSHYLSSLQGDTTLLVELVSNTLVVTCGKSKASIKTLPYEDFPTIPLITEGESIVAKTSDFVSGLRAVWYSASVSSIKPELSSVYIYQNDKELVFVATDSFRLAEKRIFVKNGSGLKGLLVPFKNVPEIIRTLEGGEEEFTLSFNKNQTSFYGKNFSLTSRIIDGNFPDYTQIIPKGHTTEVIVLKQDFLGFLKLNTIFSDKFNQIHFTVEPSNKRFELSSRNSEVGENTTALSGSFEGEDLEINFNYKYILDCFQSIQSENVSLHFNGPSKPLIIRGTGDGSFLYLAMPMNR
jgi:DNA polymerase-3 subunit beta